MSEPFIGEIRAFAGNFAPVGWAPCDGRALSISENDTLYALIGTAFGGDGITVFNLPDLRGRSAVHAGNTGFGSYSQGQLGGSESVTLQPEHLPVHYHRATFAANATSTSPAGARWAAGSSNAYSDDTADAPLAADAVGAVGGSLPHENMPPFLVVSYIIALEGIFPSRP